MTTPIKLACILSALCALLYIAPGCKKTTNITEPINVTVVRDTILIVDSPLDKQIMLYLPEPDGNLDTTWTAGNFNIYHFNKANYTGVDSVIFMANPNVVGDTTNYSQVRLFDLTDSVPIGGSTLSSNTTSQKVFLQTGNIYNALPNKEITLTIEIRGTKSERGAGGTSIAEVYNCYMFLYRK
jgi:hypothetical protein